MKKIAIIGSGIAGLSTAYSLEKKAAAAGLDIEIDLIERRNRTGGSIVSEKVDNFIIEGGPDCVFSEKPAAIKLCEEIDLRHKLLPTNDDKKGTFVFWNRKLHDLPEGVILMVPTMVKPMIFSSLISWPGKIRMGMELFIPKKTDATEETLTQFVSRRFGKELLQKIAEPLVAGIHAGDPDTMSIHSSFPRFVDLEKEYGSLIKGMITKRKKMSAMMSIRKPKYTMFMTLRDGLQELPDKLRKFLKKTTVLLESEVSSVSGKPGEGFEVTIKGKGSTAYDVVVITAPAYATSDMVRDMEPDLSALLDQINYVSTATVSLAYSNASLNKPFKGFGFIVPKVAKRKIMAATFTSTKFSYRAPEGNSLIRVFVGGAVNQHLVDQSDEDIVNMVRDELKITMGLKSEPLFTRVYKWSKAMPQYVVGHAKRIEQIEQAASKYPGFYLTGSAYRGIGISDGIVNGEKIADSAIEFLSQPPAP